MKKLLYVCIAALSLTSCGGNCDNSANGGDSATTEAPAATAQAPEAQETATGEAPTLTGDAEKDAKAVLAYVIPQFENLKSVEEMEKMDKNHPVNKTLEAFEAKCNEDPAYAEVATKIVGDSIRNTLDRVTKDLIGKMGK